MPVRRNQVVVIERALPQEPGNVRKSRPGLSVERSSQTSSRPLGETNSRSGNSGSGVSDTRSCGRHEQHVPRSAGRTASDPSPAIQASAFEAGRTPLLATRLRRINGFGSASYRESGRAQYRAWRRCRASRGMSFAVATTYCSSGPSVMRSSGVTSCSLTDDTVSPQALTCFNQRNSCETNGDVVVQPAILRSHSIPRSRGRNEARSRA